MATKLLKMINNNTQEDYCSFEVSKLLKEKGFDVSSPYWDFEKVGEMSVRKPTHSLAIKWIRENFGIHIFGSQFSITTKKYSWEIWDDKNEKNYVYKNDSDEWDFSSSEEATEAALLYTLQNLIK